GAEVNQFCAFLAANFRNNAWHFAIDHESAIALSLAKIDIRECGGIDQHIKIRPAHFFADTVQIRKIKLRAIEPGDLKSVPVFAHERSAKPSPSADDNNFHCVPAAISNGCLRCRQPETATTVSVSSCALEQRLPPQGIVHVPFYCFLQAFF